MEENYCKKSLEEFKRKGQETQQDMQQLGLGYLYLFCAGMILVGIIVLVRMFAG